MLCTYGRDTKKRGGEDQAGPSDSQVGDEVIPEGRKMREEGKVPDGNQEGSREEVPRVKKEGSRTQ